VYLVNQDNTVSVRPVTLGTADGERVAVTAGLTPGAVVVTEGGDRLRDGATVQLPGTDTTTRTAGSPGVPPSADASGSQQPNSAQRSNGAQQQQPGGAQRRGGKGHNRHKGQSAGQRQNPPPQ
jgi:membrane fusion protein, multidrug efflux system